MFYDLRDYHIKIFFDERDLDFGAYVEEIPNISAYGETQESAVENLKAVFTDCIEVAKEEGYEIPPPFKARDFSGKFLLRIPKSLHRQLSEKAQMDGISLNQEALYCLTKGLEESFIDRRIEDKINTYLSKSSGIMPEVEPLEKKIQS